MENPWPEELKGRGGPLCLGIDAGSVSLKIVVTDRQGSLLAQLAETS